MWPLYFWYGVSGAQQCTQNKALRVLSPSKPAENAYLYPGKGSHRTRHAGCVQYIQYMISTALARLRACSLWCTLTACSRSLGRPMCTMDDSSLLKPKMTRSLLRMRLRSPLTSWLSPATLSSFCSSTRATSFFSANSLTFFLSPKSPQKEEKIKKR